MSVPPLRIRAAALALMFTAVAACAAPDTAYVATLRQLCDALLTTQITAAGAADRGALVCPSTNPQPHPLHSRAGEAVYPLAVAFRETQVTKYRDAAVMLGDWMIGKQQARGGWGEDWPKYDGWTGTTSDQLISLAGAYPLLRDAMTPAERERWEHAMSAAADYIVATFPAGNMNYQPTGAVALWLAAHTVTPAKPVWLEKAAALMALTMRSINADGFITGEGDGVDLGYNIAQSIGYIAMYGRLTGDEALRQKAADLLRVHETFVYPNGTVDNSWGTRSYKWTYESGTKTAPGVYFAFALLADLDPSFAVAGRRCFEYLVHDDVADGFVQYGPAAARHASTQVPCLYSTFVRAQSLAMALVYGAEPARAQESHPLAADRIDWFRVFPTVKVAVVRTAHLMATISNYGAIRRYGREQVTRGGSITNLWLDGFGPRGMAQTSSVTIYKREEAAHMPIEGAMHPLTSRIEATIGGTYYTNLFEADGTIDAHRTPHGIDVVTTGALCSAKGDAAPVTYRITYEFAADRLTKTFAITGAPGIDVAIVEPYVKSAGLEVSETSPRTIAMRTSNGKRWAVNIADASVPTRLAIGEDADKYWCPFPAVDCVPLVAKLTTGAGVTHLTLVFGPEAGR